MDIKYETPTKAGVSQKIKQLRWLNHATSGILVNIRYQFEKSNSALQPRQPQHIMHVKNFICNTRVMEIFYASDREPPLALLFKKIADDACHAVDKTG